MIRRKHKNYKNSALFNPILIPVKGECMITIPNDVITKYIAYLIKTGVLVTSHAE
jgi:hypothetical protein